SATNDLAGAMAEIAARPGYYLNDAALALVDEAFNKSLIEFNIDKKHPDDDSGRIRVRPRDLLTFLRNPAGTIDKAFAKAQQERKWTSTGLLGMYLDMGIAGGWARKNGFDPEDVSNLMGAA